MRKFEFYKLDVFTKTRFSGNQLAVFPAGEGLTKSEMQQIANEMNLSETVFVLPSENALRRLRIFTPQQELPLAGHPVVGTWNLLAHLNVPAFESKEILEIKQELNLGILPVEIDYRVENEIKVTMTQSNFTPGEIIDDEAEITALAKSLGLERNDLANNENLPIQAVSTGIKAIDIPVKSLEKLKSCKINSSSLSEIYLKYGAVGCYAFTFETLEKDSAIHARFFAPADSIPEDPATGSAAGSLSGYLIHHGAIKKNKFIIEQGDFMKRPSRIFSEVEGNKGNVSKVKIGGYSVIMAKGEIFLD